MDKIFKKLAKKDPQLFVAVEKKIEQVLHNPYAFKPMRAPLRGIWEVHVGSFVLTYRIVEEKRIV